MKQRLWIKLLGSFVIVIVLNAVILSLVVNNTLNRRYRAFVDNSALRMAERIAPILESYYAERGSFAGIEALLEHRDPMSEPRSGFRGPGASRGHRMMGAPAEHPGAPSIIVTDASGRIVADAPGELPQGAALPDAERGVPLTVDGREVGRVFFGSMVSPGLSESDRAALASLQRALLLSSAGATAGAVVLVLLLVWHITAPLRRLGEASARIAAGDLSARVRPTTRDEIGDVGRRFDAMADSLARSAEWRARVISDLAHELRTPVSLLKGHLEMLLEGIYAIDRKAIAALHEESETLNRLVSDLQELATVESDATVLREERVEMAALAERMAELFSSAARRNDVGITVACAAEQTAVRGDAQRLEQVLGNLLSNALRFAPSGSEVRVAVSSGMRAPPHEAADRASTPAADTIVRLTVEDEGPGIPEEERERVFERFYRIDPARSREEGGRGIGLAISREIVLRHGGDIRIEAGENGGARVTIDLPAA